MGLRVYQNPKCWQTSSLTTPRSLCHPRKPPPAIPSSTLRHLSDSDNALPFRLIYRSAFSGSKGLRVQRVKRACIAHFGEFSDEETMNLIKRVVEKLDMSYEDDDNDENDMTIANRICKNTQIKGSAAQFWTTKHDYLKPALLGIQPEPPSWPERDKVLRMSFERKVSSLGIPFSIRIIQKKLQWQKGFKEASKVTYCSVKKTFSSMVFIMHELQNYALQIRESLYCEDLQGLMAKLRSEMDTSFVWLFQQVLWKTPILMVYVMVLLANFSVFSMSNNTVFAVTPPSLIKEVMSLTQNKTKQPPEVDANFSKYGCRDNELTQEDILWNSVLREVSRLQEESRTGAFVNETMQQFVAPVSVELEEDAYEEYERTELCYKRNIYRAPHNSLLLSNYAQFLYLVNHDLDKAEEYFRRSVMEKPPDAEALSRYADFLWLVRKDLREAEMRYLQAVDADPDNTHHASKYATFIWSTGGEGTCVPLQFIDNLENFDPVS